MLVSLDPRGRRRPRAELPPLTGSAEHIARTLHDLAEAGADEAILVLDPIDEPSVRKCGAVLAALDAVPPLAHEAAGGHVDHVIDDAVAHGQQALVQVDAAAGVVRDDLQVARRARGARSRRATPT